MWSAYSSDNFSVNSGIGRAINGGYTGSGSGFGSVIDGLYTCRCPHFDGRGRMFI